MDTKLVKVSDSLRDGVSEAIQTLREVCADSDAPASSRVQAARGLIATALDVQAQADRAVSANEIDMQELDTLIANQRTRIAEAQQ